jgi:hypothetical protein
MKSNYVKGKIDLAGVIVNTSEHKYFLINNQPPTTYLQQPTE